MSAPLILLVDDDLSILETTQIAVQGAGYRVVLAHDGSEALRRVEQDAPQLVVMDMMMPYRSGFAVLDRLRSGHQSAPRVIIVSGNAEQKHRDMALTLGANAFLAKPFEMPELLRLIADLLSSPDAHSPPA